MIFRGQQAGFHLHGGLPLRRAFHLGEDERMRIGVVADAAGAFEDDARAAVGCAGGLLQVLGRQWRRIGEVAAELGVGQVERLPAAARAAGIGKVDQPVQARSMAASRLVSAETSSRRATSRQRMAFSLPSALSSTSDVAKVPVNPRLNRAEAHLVVELLVIQREKTLRG